jgi:serine/threonine protein kinase/tetratricopeptide (TPR) repeat protein
MTEEAQALDAVDEEFLDGAFERAVASLEQGSNPRVEELLDGREHLRAHVVALLHTARQASLVAPDALPKVPGFVVQAEIGRGGMGTVYLARQETLAGRRVALKVLPPSAALSVRARDRFLREARAIANLRHPNVITVHDVMADGDTCAYAMEWVEGASLAQLIDFLRTKTRRATFAGETRDSASLSAEPKLADVREFLGGSVGVDQDTYAVFVSRIAIALARALGELHRAGLLHRDIKPSNVLLRRDGTPLLSDFGLVRDVDGTVTQDGQFVGTLAYASPEQLGGESESLDARSDVYAFGVTLYEALTLRLPFDDPRDGELRSRRRRENTPTAMQRWIESRRTAPLRAWNRRLPRDLETIVLKAMDAERAHRYATADELADDLERMLSLQPIRARPAGLASRSLKLLRRNRAAALGIAGGSVASLVLATLAVIYLFLVPDWVRSHVRDARVALLDPDIANAIFMPVYWGAPGTEAVGKSALEAALGHYDDALRWAPFDRELRAERDAVHAVLFLPHDPPTDDAAPRTEGLRAYLRGNADVAMEAWERFEREQDPTVAPDPLVASGLGILYLVRGESARAYPRLRDACQAFPNAAFLTTYHADAALRCGDLDTAEALLSAAAGMPQPDPLSASERVRADLFAAQGVDDGAENLYQRGTRNSFVVSLHYARFLESRGRPEEALVQYVRAANEMHGIRVQREYVAFMERWWANLPCEQRLRHARSALDLELTDPHSLVMQLQLHAAALRRIDVAEDPTRTASDRSAVVKPERARTLPEHSSSRCLEGPTLTDVAVTLEIDNTSRWTEIRRYPPLLKDLHAAAWRLPSPRPLQWLTAVVDRLARSRAQSSR